MIRFALLLPLLAAACCPKQTCPTPARPLAPAPVVTVAPSTPCVLPPRPAQFELVGMASDAGVLVTKSDLKGLQLWLSSMNDWAASAALCLESR